MKRFTKIALIVSLVLVILGAVCCAVSLGTGFNFSEFRNEVMAGKYSIGFPFVSFHSDFNWDDDQAEWQASSGDTFSFECSDIDSLDMDVYYGDLNIVQTTGNDICVEVEYRKEDSKRRVNVSADGKTLVIKETGSKKSIHNDSTRITIQIPEEMSQRQWKEIELCQSAGNVYIDTPLTAKNIEIEVDAGECISYHKLTASKELSVDVGAGNMELHELEAESIEMDAGIGSLITGEIIAEKIDISCGIGSITTVASGAESDYSYDIECGIGNVEIGKKQYSGSSFVSEDSSSDDREIAVECGIGEVQVKFSGQKTDDTVNNGVTDDDITDNSVTDDAADDDVIDNGVTDDGVTDNSVTNNGVTDNGVTDNSVTNNGVTHHEEYDTEDVTNNGTTHHNEHDSHE